MVDLASAAAVKMDDESRRFFMTDPSAEHDHALRLLIRHKVHDGRLPHNRIGTISTVLGAGGSCDACETSISKGQLVTEVTLAGGRGARGTVSFHALCFQLWDAERKEPRA